MKYQCITRVNAQQMSGIRPQQVSGARLKSLKISHVIHKRTAAVQFRVRNQSVTNISDPYDYHWCATSIRVQHVSRVRNQHESWSSSQLVTRICVQHVFGLILVFDPNRSSVCDQDLASVLEYDHALASVWILGSQCFCDLSSTCDKDQSLTEIRA